MKPASAGRLSHAYIISSVSEAERDRMAWELAAAAVCSSPSDAPCGSCRDCRKAKAGIHPDILVVDRLTDDKGRQKRDITVDQIRAVIGDAVVLPNEARRKVYLIRSADTMNASAQNAALKLLEEPPAWVVLLLCAANDALLLPTVRSRCVQLGSNGGDTEPDGEAKRLAREYLTAVAAGDEARLFAWCTANEGLSTAQTTAFCGAVKDLAADVLCGREKIAGLDRTELLSAAALMDRCGAYLRVNTGVKHIFGLLAVHSLAYAGK